MVLTTPPLFTEGTALEHAWNTPWTGVIRDIIQFYRCGQLVHGVEVQHDLDGSLWCASYEEVGRAIEP